MNHWQPDRAFVPHILEPSLWARVWNAPAWKRCASGPLVASRLVSTSVLAENRGHSQPPQSHCELRAISGAAVHGTCQVDTQLVSFIQGGCPHVSSPFQYCKHTLMVVHFWALRSSLTFKETVYVQISPGCSYSLGLGRLADYVSNFHILLGAFCKS